ncbi:MAG: outer membrane protein [Pseudomonadota bacterium]
MRYILSAAGVLLFAVGTTSVLAADLPSEKGPPVYTPAPPVFSWTGAYVGGQIGIQWGDTSWDRYDPTDTIFIDSEFPYRTNGVVGGGHIGYNYQVNQFVFGVEGDVEGTNFNGNGTSNGNNWANTIRSNIEASIRARAGIAFDQLLFYVTGGGAYANFHTTAQNPPGIFYASDDFDRIGWTAGGGLEYAIDSNWSVRAEDRFTEFGHHTFFTGTENIHQGLWDNRVEAGFSYKFGEPPPPAPPVVAKY